MQASYILDFLTAFIARKQFKRELDNVTVFFTFSFNWRIVIILCRFLSYINMNQPQAHTCPSLLDLPPHPTPLGYHRVDITELIGLACQCPAANPHWLSVLHMIVHMFRSCSLYPSHPLCLGDRSRDRSLFSPFSRLILYCSSLLGSFQMPVLYSLESSLTLPALQDLCRVLMSWSRTKLKLIPWVILNAFRVTEYYFNNPLAFPLGFHQHLFTSLT